MPLAHAAHDERTASGELPQECCDRPRPRSARARLYAELPRASMCPSTTNASTTNGPGRPPQLLRPLHDAHLAGLVLDPALEVVHADLQPGGAARDRREDRQQCWHECPGHDAVDGGEAGDDQRDLLGPRRPPLPHAGRRGVGDQPQPVRRIAAGRSAAARRFLVMLSRGAQRNSSAPRVS